MERRRYERRRDERERSVLADQLITAEQEERRRLALFLHDGPVQTLAGIALMLDAVGHAVEAGRLEDARRVLDTALERQRQAIRSLRDLSFDLEPVVLRDQGFGPAVQALADHVGIQQGVRIELSLDAAEEIAEQAQVALYQIIREALNQAMRRSPGSVVVEVTRDEAGDVQTVVADDGADERRRGGLQMLQERARTLDGEVAAVPGPDGGTIVRVTLPAHRVSR